MLGMLDSASLDHDYLDVQNKYKVLCQCRGQRSPRILAQLRCHYSVGSHPYLTLMPYKEEVASLEPPISIFYDVISDKEIETVKKLATPKLKRAGVINDTTGGTVYTSQRISKTGWLKPVEYLEVEKLYSRIGDITGLSMIS